MQECPIVKQRGHKIVYKYLKHYILIEKFAFPDKWYKKWGEVGPILASYQVL